MLYEDKSLYSESIFARPYKSMSNHFNYEVGRTLEASGIAGSI